MSDDQSEFARRAAAEIDGLHRVLQAWFRAEGSSDPQIVLDHFDPAFVMMTPAGGILTYEQFAGGLPKARGSRPTLIMEITDVEVRHVDADAALVTYHERQTQEALVTNRISTAFLLNRPVHRSRNGGIFRKR